MRGKKSRNPKKKEYVTFMLLPGPNSRVRTLIVSKAMLKSVILSLVGLLILSVYFIYEYNNVKQKAWELQSMREEIMQQKAQVQNFVLNLIDYKRQMSLIRALDTKLRQAESLGPLPKAQLFLGIGGPDELGHQNPATIGEQKQDESPKETHQELTHTNREGGIKAESEPTDLD